MEAVSLFFSNDYDVFLQGRKGYNKFEDIPISSNVVLLSYGNENHSGFHQYLDYLNFSLHVFINTLRFAPSLILAVDHHAFIPAAVISKLFSVPLILWKLEISGERGSFFERLLFILEKNFAKYTKASVFPNKERMKDFLKHSRLKKTYIVFNSVSKEYVGKVKQEKNTESSKKGFLVVRQGGIGNDHSILETIMALTILPKNVRFIIIGYCRDSKFLGKMKDKIREHKIEDRIEIILNLDRVKILSILKKSNIGVVLYKPVSKTTQLSGTSSMKLAEYIASGIPAVVNNNQIMRDLNKKVGSFVFADPYSPESIANAIKEVIYNPDKTRKLRKNAKRAFETFYNFEYQFNPVLKEIEKWTKK